MERVHGRVTIMMRHSPHQAQATAEHRAEGKSHSFQRGRSMRIPLLVLENNTGNQKSKEQALYIFKKNEFSKFEIYIRLISHSTKIYHSRQNKDILH